MPDILVRNVPAAKIKRLKALARSHGRSLQSEARSILENAAGAEPEEIRDMFAAWKQRLAGRRLRGSARMIREDRKR